MRREEKLDQVESLDVTKYMSLTEAASKIGLSRDTIRQYLYEGKLTTYKLKHQTLVLKDELAQLPRRAQA